MGSWCELYYTCEFATSVILYEYLHSHKHVFAPLYLPVKVGSLTSLLPAHDICEAYFVTVCKAF